MFFLHFKAIMDIDRPKQPIKFIKKHEFIVNGCFDIMIHDTSKFERFHNLTITKEEF